MNNVTNDSSDRQQVARMGHIPSLPLYFLPRPEDVQLKAMVLFGKINKIVITDSTGWAGIGKSVLAMALAHDPQVRQSFPDGIIWLTLGAQPSLTILQSYLAITLEESTTSPPVFEEVPTGVAWLRSRLENKACLLILDDVRSSEHLAAFSILGPRGCLVLTTRDTRWLSTQSNLSIPQEEKKLSGKKKSRRPPKIMPTQEDNQEILMLDAFTDEQALTLLGNWAQQPVTELSPLALKIAHECDNLPLALAMMGALSEGMIDSWEDTLEQIREIDPELFRRKFTDNLSFAPKTLRALQIAINSLEPEFQRCYLDLAIFPENTAIPLSLLQAVWSPENQNDQRTVLDETDVERIVIQFEQRALLQREDGHLRLHELQYAYLQKYAGTRSLLHARFLRNVENQFLNTSRHAGKLPPWDLLPSDEFYLWQYLPYHLANAGQYAELGKLLTDFHWLRTRLEIVDILTFRAAYSLPPHEETLGRIHEVFRLATPILSKDRNQLAGQLLGRLLGLRLPGLRGLIKQAMRWKGTPWLRPLTDSLIVPGGALEHTLANPRERIQTLAVTPNGQLLIAGSIEGRIKIWDLEQWIELYSLSSQHGAIHGIAILSEGSRLLLATDDGTLELWDLERHEVECTLKGHRNRINAVVVTQNGRQAISASADGTLKVWNLEQRTLIYTLKASSPVHAVAVTMDGGYAISASDHGIQLWDLVHRSEKRTYSGHQAPVSAVAITPDGHKIISGSLDATLKIWSLEQGTVIHTLKGHTGSIRALTLTPDGQWIVSASNDGEVRVWDLERGMERCTLSGHQGEVWTVEVTWDGRAISAGADRILRIWDLERGADLHTLTGHRDAVNAVALLPDGIQILSASDDRTIKVWDMKWRRAALRVLTGHTRDVSALAVSVDGQLAISGAKDKTLKVWNLKQGKELHTLTGHSAPIRAVALTLDGQRAISGSSDRTLRVWDLEHGNPCHTLVGHQGAITAVITCGEQAISASLDGTLKLWDLQRGIELPALVENITAGVGILALAIPTPSIEGNQNSIPDPLWVIAGAEDGTIQIWPTVPDGERYLWSAHQGAVTALAVTTDGRTVISGSSDHTLRVWDLPREQALMPLITKNLNPHRKESNLVENPECIAEFTGESAILTCAVAADGVTIIAGEKSGRIHFLRLQLD